MDMWQSYRIILFTCVSLFLQNCGNQYTDSTSDQRVGASLSSSDGVAAGYVDIMTKDRMNFWKPLLPRMANPALDSFLQSATTMWYDKDSMVPGYQDSMGDPVGMRPNTIAAVMIDTAVPGGHARLFSKRGHFQFPFGSGGIDKTVDVETINFWIPPRNTDGKVIPVAYWSSGFTRVRWVFPVGTILGEILFLKFPNGSYAPFEVRTRKRNIDDWESDVFKPFPTALSLAEAIKSASPTWDKENSLSDFIAHLKSNDTLTEKTLETKAFPGTFAKMTGYVDNLPDMQNPELTLRLLKTTPFVSTKNSVWKQNGSKVAYGATAVAAASIVPRHYDGALFPPTNEFCSRCHSDAGRSIGDWHSDLVAYGELWGEDRTFSWHLFDKEMFVDSVGDVKNFNNDNRRLRDDLRAAGLLIPQNPNTNSPVYRELSRTWEWHPF